MINLFLRAKHWQLFLLMFAVPMLFNMVFMGTLISKVAINDTPEQVAEMFKSLKWLPIIIVLGTFGMFGWLISVGIGLYKYVPKSVPMRIGLFKVLMAIAAMYFLFFSFWMSSFISNVSAAGFAGNEPDLSMLSWLILIIPLHFFSIFAMIYVFWFNAKSFRSIELAREASSSEYIGQFFLFWFSIVGIWVMQPTINKIVDGTIEPPADSPISKREGISPDRDILD
ncbi:MAG: hypothetical protein HRT57_04565 [Crocinitomicaceae bacterium]|nr:hypothetical protein [Crocinitomicaceae bacterium]